jgi:hypothetical protein
VACENVVRESVVSDSVVRRSVGAEVSCHPKKAKEQCIEYIRRPFSLENQLIDGTELEKHISKYIS